MTNQQFKQVQLLLGFTNVKMAELLCVSVDHVGALRRGYKTDKNGRIPVLATRKDLRIIEQALQLAGIKIPEEVRF